MPRQLNKLEASEPYVEHFGELLQQAALLSIDAYTAGGRSVDITRAWLLEDQESVDRLTWREKCGDEHAQAVLNAALLVTALEMWNSNDMLQTSRPHSLDDCEMLHRLAESPLSQTG